MAEKQLGWWRRRYEDRASSGFSGSYEPPEVREWRTAGGTEGDHYWAFAGQRWRKPRSEYLRLVARDRHVCNRRWLTVAWAGLYIVTVWAVVHGARQG